ncbi:Actinin-type, actin-binding domain-containing protein [Rozella allomycis CSF55]|uniref:Fimbrin n=1 Tax=Rozella allomycis (strain CSF55) TaxID=988480 RepID=A0A075AUY2_ROZAC|nr:Actinin-type, actin-binding domain-containing protein [Rozella allomycis CSF55]|eukprot:EPZ33975.1 Actinin-type, actin-binding domain-containing protein [Rozella allomycis CSF55]
MTDYYKTASKYAKFSKEEIDDFVKVFREFDKDSNGSIDARELIKVYKQLGENVSFDEVRRQIQEVDTDKSGTIEFDEFLQLIEKMKLGVSDEKGVAKAVSQVGKITTFGGATSSTQHSINEDEQEQFASHINQVLKNDKDVGGKLPIDTHSMAIYEACKDGLVLSKLINDSVPDTIDERVLNISPKLNPFQMTENNNVVINSAKAIGCSVVNIGSQDLIEGRPHLILGLIWQIIKIGLLAKINLQLHPELFRLLDKDETLEDFLKLPADAILLRWVNYHLKKAEHSKRINNFSNDIKDSEAYIVLLNQLAPEVCSRDALKEEDLLKRAELMLKNTEKLDCRKYITAKAVVSGNPKLNLAFVANLFNIHPGLEPLSEAEMAALDEGLFASQGDRESRAFALWMNSLGVEPFVTNIFEDLKDGLVLLQVFDKIHPGSVVWSKVNTKTPVTSRFKRVENTNYAVLLGKSSQYSLVGIQGADLTDGVKNLTLALVWQMMRDHVIETLKVLNKNGNEIKENEIIEWANATVKRAAKTTSMSSFKDPSLSTGHFFLDLMAGIKKGIVNYELVTPASTPDEAKLNAKYAISIARKLGATIFVLPEDIMEVKPKMILTFVGTLMAVDRKIQAQSQ